MIIPEFKKLAWKAPSAGNNSCWTADCILGTYSVVNEDGWHASLEDSVTLTQWEWEPDEDRRSFVGEHAAQQACQDHFETQIKSTFGELPSTKARTAREVELAKVVDELIDLIDRTEGTIPQDVLRGAISARIALHETRRVSDE